MLSAIFRGLGLTTLFEHDSGLRPDQTQPKPKIPAKSGKQFSRLRERGFWKCKPVHFGDKFKNLRL